MKEKTYSLAVGHLTGNHAVKQRCPKKKICSRKLLLRTVNSAEFIPYYITQWDLQAPYLEQTTWSW